MEHLLRISKRAEIGRCNYNSSLSVLGNIFLRLKKLTILIYDWRPRYIDDQKVGAMKSFITGAIVIQFIV